MYFTHKPHHAHTMNFSGSKPACILGIALLIATLPIWICHLALHGANCKAETRRITKEIAIAWRTAHGWSWTRK